MDDIKLIDSLLKRVEAPGLDFKSTYLRTDEPYLKAHFIKDLICMANTPRDGSSYIIYGVISKPDGSKEITGVMEHPDDANLQELATSKITPVPRFHYRPVMYKGNSLGIIEIFPDKSGPFIPQFNYEHLINKGVIYYRRGSSNTVASSSELRSLIAWIEGKRSRRQAKYTGLSFIDIGGGIFNFPCYFPSISSLRTPYKPLQYLKILLKSNYPWFLISAYDIAHAEDEEKPILIDLMKEAVAVKKVLLDSGYYESSSKNDTDWSERNYYDIVRKCEFTFAFSFDKRENIENKSNNAIAKEVIESWKQNVEESSKYTIIPIIHANMAGDFPEIVPQVVQAINPIMIAIPERELGEGIISTARTIFDIRKVLHEIGSSCPVHLLGTGNPVSILIYTACGANSYDGLEWCQMILDYNTALLYHMKHYDFLEYQSDWAGLPGIKRELAALMHNIEFYISWMTQLHTAINKGEITNLLQNYLPLVWDKNGHIVNPLDLLIKKIPEVFQDS